MQRDSQPSSSIYLKVHIHGLMDDIGQMNAYLNKPVAGKDAAQLPLGVIGQIMVSELHSESKMLEQKMKHFVFSKQEDRWEKAKISSAIRKKISMLMTLSTLIVQLPAANPQAQAEAFHLSQRVVNQCEKIDVMLAMVVSQALVGAHYTMADS